MRPAFHIYNGYPLSSVPVSDGGRDFGNCGQPLYVLPSVSNHVAFTIHDERHFVAPDFPSQCIDEMMLRRNFHSDDIERAYFFLNSFPKYIRVQIWSRDEVLSIFSFSFRTAWFIGDLIKERSVVSGQVENSAIGYLKTTRDSWVAGNSTSPNAD